MKFRREHSRFVAPALLLFPFLQSLYVCPFPLPWVVCSECPVFYCVMNPKTSPLRSFLLVSLPVTGLLFGRAFCSWGCPYGALQETSSLIGEKLGVCRPLRNKLTLFKVTLFIFTFLVAFSLAYPILLGFLPQTLPSLSLLESIYIVSVTLHSFILKFPWLVPSLKVLLFISFLWLSIFLSRGWCKVCPLGLLISIFNKTCLIVLRVDRKLCRECDCCSQVCQMGLYPLRDGLGSIDCIKCLSCVWECGSSAIKLKIHKINSQ